MVVPEAEPAVWSSTISSSSTTDAIAPPHLCLAERKSSLEQLNTGRMDAALFPRLINRLTDRHSSGRFNIEKKGRKLRDLYCSDWFHSLVNSSTQRILIVVFVLYYATFSLFALIYWKWVAHTCAPDMLNFTDAMYFSVSIMMTLGFGMDDVYQKNCSFPLAVISIQTICGVLMASTVVGIILVRISRGTKRAESIIFSDKAIIREIRGNFFFMFRVAEQRRHQMLDTKVRVYAIRDEVDAAGVGAFFQTMPMRLSHPDDAIGSNLLLFVPSTVVHRIDTWSPLFPQPPKSATVAVATESLPAMTTPTTTTMRTSTVSSGTPNTKAREQQTLATPLLDRNGSTNSSLRAARYMGTAEATPFHHHSTSYIYPDMLLRADDADCGMRSMNLYCPQCGAEFQSTTALELHMSSCTVVSGEGGKCISSARPDSAAAMTAWMECKRSVEYARQLTAEQIHRHMLNTKVEVLVWLEGVDPITGNTVSARHSYSACHGDILFGHAFVPCVSREEEGPWQSSHVSGPDDSTPWVQRCLDSSLLCCASEAEDFTRGGCVVDFAAFHDTFLVSTEAAFEPQQSV